MVRIFMSVLFLMLTMTVAGAYASTEKKESNGVVDFIPFFQDETRAAGRVPPKPFFISPMYFYMEDYMKISDVTASGKLEGTNAYIPANVTMDDVTTTTNTTGVMAGVNIFPFLSVFGMYLYTDGYTEFKATAVMPGTLKGPYTVNNKMTFNANTYAVGANATYGMADVFWGWDIFGIFNANFAWTKANLLEDIITTVVFSPRLGVSKSLTKDMSVALWFGGMYKDMLNDSEWVSGQYTVSIPQGSFEDGITDKPSLEVESKYNARQRPEAPWNLVVGGAFTPCRYFTLLSEVGFINRLTVNVGMQFKF